MWSENRLDMRLVVVFGGIIVPKQVHVNLVVAESAHKHKVFKVYPVRIAAGRISKNQIIKRNF